MPPGGGRKGTDPKQEELKYNMFILHCFSGRKRAQLCHPDDWPSLGCFVWGEGVEFCEYGLRDMMLSYET